MKTRVLPISSASIQEACHILRQGDLVAFPTETVYGLGALGLLSASVQKIFEAKGRPSTDPLILHLASTNLAQAQANGVITDPIPKNSQLLAEAFWPGPLTLILPRGPKVPLEVTAGLETVAIRCPSHLGAQQLLTAIGSPLAAPSANRFGRISPTDASAVLQELDGKIPLILDGGPCLNGIESTVVSFSKTKPTILRPGVITVQAISQLLGMECEILCRTQLQDTPASSPGMLASHYAPLSPLYSCLQPIKTFLPKFQHILFHSPQGSKPDHAHILSPNQRPEEAAQNLYRLLRIADAQSPQAILIDPIPPSDLAPALQDRILRASTGSAIWREGSWIFQARDKT
jgi:L-threonylcarbamoyladenylate synthase